jgi:signal transduction histidine kinase
LRTALDEGKFEDEGWRVRKDGSRFWAHVVVDAIHDDAGTLVGFAKVTRDVTERKHAAETLERANAALFQSQKMESLGQLTGGVAHDFNNLLAVMSNGLDVLSLRVQDRADLRMLETMQPAVARRNVDAAVAFFPAAAATQGRKSQCERGDPRLRGSPSACSRQRDSG